MLDLQIWAFWFIFGAYSFWFFFKAKTFQPLTLDDLALTWKLHKRQTGCTASRIHSLLTKNGKVVGFKCDCGYEFLQKRLITQKVHKQRVSQKRLQSFHSSRVGHVERSRQCRVKLHALSLPSFFFLTYLAMIFPHFGQ